VCYIAFRYLNIWSFGSPPHLYKLGPSRPVVQDRKTVKSLDPFELNRTRWQLRAYFRDAFWHVNARAAKGAAFVATRSRINPRGTSFTRSLWAELSNPRLATAKSDTFGSRWSIVSRPARKFHFTTDNEFSLSPFRFPPFPRQIYYRNSGNDAFMFV